MSWGSRSGSGSGSDVGSESESGSGLSWSMWLSSSVSPVLFWALSLVVCVVLSCSSLPSVSPTPPELPVIVRRFVWPVVDEPVGRQGGWVVWDEWAGWAGLVGWAGLCGYESFVGWYG